MRPLVDAVVAAVAAATTSADRPVAIAKLRII
jgi:hypothetical protein